MPDHFPGVSNLNQGAYSTFEKQLRDLANTPGNKVWADFRAVFNEGNLTHRPDAFRIEFKVNDGVSQVKNFLNQPGG